MAAALAALFLDAQLMRIAKVEYDLPQIGELREKIQRLEEKIDNLDAMTLRIAPLEQQVARVSSVALRLGYLEHRLAMTEEMMMSQILEKTGLKVYKTRQSSAAVADARIGGHPEHQQANWGGLKVVGVGTGDPDCVFRTLIRFNEIQPDFLNNAKILAATLYLNQTGRLKEGEAALNETLHVFAVKKYWEEGNQVNGVASPGQVSWLATRTGQGTWSISGCGSEIEDYDPVVLATSGPALWGGAEGWVPLRFTVEGIRRLQSWFNGEDHHRGFLIKSAREHTPRTLLEFYSSEYNVESDRPFLEIFYVE